MIRDERRVRYKHRTRIRRYKVLYTCSMEKKYELNVNNMEHVSNSIKSKMIIIQSNFSFKRMSVAVATIYMSIFDMAPRRCILGP